MAKTFSLSSLSSFSLSHLILPQTKHEREKKRQDKEKKGNAKTTQNMISFPVSHPQLQLSPHCSLLPSSVKFPDVSFSFSSSFFLPAVTPEFPRRHGGTSEEDGREIRGFSGRSFFFAHRRRTRERKKERDNICVCFASFQG
jgi:hypothetical protein